MSDTNGSTDFPMTGDPRTDAALSRLRERLDKHNALLVSIEDALVVNAHLEKRQSELIRQHSEALVQDNERLVQHKEFISRHEDFMSQHDTKMREIDEKLNALIDIVMRREGGLEARL